VIRLCRACWNIIELVALALAIAGTVLSSNSDKAGANRLSGRGEIRLLRLHPSGRRPKARSMKSENKYFSIVKVSIKLITYPHFDPFELG
jgi:hypothetical protein